MRNLVPREMRVHFTSFGDQKRKYAPEAAGTAGERLKQEPYECPMCGYWHLATPKPLTKRRRR